MKRIFIISLGLIFFISCQNAEKSHTIKQRYNSLNKAEVLQKADANFEELDKEAEKPVEELSLPESREEAIKPSLNIPEEKKANIPQEKKLSIKTKYPLKNGYPIWVYNPNYGGYIGAVGIAKKDVGGYTEQKRIAVMVAQANLAKQIKLLVNSTIYTEKILISKKDYEEYKSKLKSLSKQEAQAYLKNTVVKDEWIDPKTGDLYVWVVLEK